MNKQLIDVSEFQGNINWRAVKNSGIEYAIIRAGGRFGSSGKLYTDSKAVTNITGALNSGIKIGVYFFTQAVSEAEAVEEAEYTLDIISSVKDKITLPIYIDSEFMSGGRHSDISTSQRTKVIKAFTDRIKRAGYTSGVYGSTSWLNDKIDMSLLDGISVWVAQYYKECQYRGKYDVWQYTSGGEVNGIDGKCDMNILYNIPSYKEKEYSDSTKVKAVDVILGKYGNGEERAKKLGSSYKEVQSLVNEIFGRLGL